MDELLPGTQFTQAQLDNFLEGERQEAARKEWLYRVCCYTCAGIALLTSWAYCTATYGFLWGFGFGWVPGLIVGIAAWFIGAALGRIIYYGWPLAVLYVIFFTKLPRQTIDWLYSLF